MTIQIDSEIPTYHPLRTITQITLTITIATHTRAQIVKIRFLVAIKRIKKQNIIEIAMP
jgi:hypothetical protein